jgi:Tol biopolymer transport system component
LEGGDVWIMDLATGAAHNITEGSGREHISAQWWPARPDTIVLMSWGENDTGPNSGKLTLVNADGSDYRVAHPEGDVSYAEPAPSPDGVTIAYDEAGIPMLYTIDGGAEPFAPNSFSGFPAEVTFPHGGSPAWSPDGAELAWVLAANGGGYGTSSGWDVVVGVFDLTTGEARLLHPFQPVGRGGWFAAPRWSPDGQWLAFHVEATSADERGLWIIAADGSSEQQLTRADLGTALGTARWNPPGPQPWTNPAHLLYSTYTTGDGIDYYVAQAGNWGTAVVQLPEGAMLTDWVAIE